MRTDRPDFWALLIASLFLTVFIWLRIFRSRDLLAFKIAFMVISAVPVLGPILYFTILQMPSRLPLEQQQQPFPKGTQVYPSFKPLIKILLCILFGAKDKEKL